MSLESQIFLINRREKSGNIDIEMEKGCRQGLSLGPIMWSIVMQGWFQKIDETNTEWKENRARERDTIIKFISDLTAAQA